MNEFFIFTLKSDNKKDKEEIEKELNDIKTSLKKKEFEEFIDKQIEKGTLVPANKNIVLCPLKSAGWSILNLSQMSPSVISFVSGAV